MTTELQAVRRGAMRMWLWHTVTAVQAEIDFCLLEISITCTSAPFDPPVAADMLQNRICHLSTLRVARAEQIQLLLRQTAARRGDA